MNKKIKLAMAIGTTLVVGIGGYLIYRGYNNRKTKAARSYLGELEENGGEPKTVPKSQRRPVSIRQTPVRVLSRSKA